MLQTTPAPLHRVDGGPVLPAGSAAWLLARSGNRLRAARFAPTGHPRGSVVLSLGRTEPIEKYGEVIGELVERGFVTLVHDWAGQGLSGRFLGDPLACDMVGGWQQRIADYADILEVHAEHLPKPWIAMGHSMGGALTALVLCEGETRFAGAALCAPMLQFTAAKLPMGVARVVVTLALRLGRGTRTVLKQADPTAVNFDENVLTHDRSRHERTRTLYRAHSELRLGVPTWRWLYYGIELGDRLARPGAAERITCPVAVVAAGDDRLVENSAIRRFITRVPGGLYRELPGAFHEILMEVDAHRREWWKTFDQLVDSVAPQH